MRQRGSSWRQRRAAQPIASELAREPFTVVQRLTLGESLTPDAHGPRGLALPDISANRKRIRRHQSSTAAVLVGLYPMTRGAQAR